MFDAAHPGPDGAPNTLVPVTVWRHRDFEVGSGGDQDIHFLLAVGGVPRVIRG